MASLWLDKCCVCIPLRVGSFFIGYLLTIYKTVAMLMTTIHLALLVTITGQHPEVVTPSVTLNKFLLYAMDFIYTVQMMMNICLLVGLHKNKLINVKKYMTIYPIFLALFIIVFVIALASFGREFSAFEWYLHIPDVMVVLFEIYGVFVVKRCYLDLEAKGVDTSPNV